MIHDRKWREKAERWREKEREEKKNVKIWKEKENKYSFKQISRRSGEERERVMKRKDWKEGVKEKKMCSMEKRCKMKILRKRNIEEKKTWIKREKKMDEKD